MTNWIPQTFEEAKIYIYLLIWIMIFMSLVANWFFDSKKKDDYDIDDEIKIDPDLDEKNTNILKNKLKKEEIMLEDMCIKRDEIENKIEKHSYSIHENIDDENKNEIEVRKFKLALKQANLKIEEKEESIRLLKDELWIV